MRLFRSFLADKTGSILPVAAVSMVILLGATALSIDVGNFYYQRRRLQSAADLSSIAAAGNIASAQQAAAATLALNGYSASTLTNLEYGVYNADPRLRRFAGFNRKQAAWGQMPSV
jgi:uncharacterized membrane protein